MISITQAMVRRKFRIIFDVPGNPAHLYRRSHGETLMGDVFDLNRFKHIKSIKVRILI